MGASDGRPVSQVRLAAAPGTRQLTQADQPHDQQRACDRADDDAGDCAAREGVGACGGAGNLAG